MFDALTEREHEILLLLSQGLTNKDIASRLYLSAGTIKAHNHNIFSKLGVSSRTQALLRAQELGLLTLSDEAQIVPAASDHSVTLTTNLPAQFTPFLGRKSECDKLLNLLDDPRVRLITVSGIGGTGKTRLAIEVAHKQTARFADGVFFVSLARVTDVPNIPAAISDDIGLRYQIGENLGQQLLTFLHNKSMLLVLDNFEHLLEGADFIAQILQASPHIKLLVTSRERLNLSAEVLLVLSGLDYHTQADGSDAVISSAAQLLIQRTRLINPSFDLQPSDWPAVRRICQLTNGMPLALILAAGWTEMLSFEEIAAELTQSMDILETQLRDLPTRQRSMRAAIASSWGRFSPDEQAGFASLSVFRGGFTREAAYEVAGVDLRALQTLVNRSFIVANAGRYEIHELLRQYGWEQLQQVNQAGVVCTRHSNYYLNFLHERDNTLKGRGQCQAIDEIYADFENIRAAWVWAVEQRHYEALGRAVDCLVNFAEMRIFLVRVEELLRRSVTGLAPTGDEPPHPVYDQMMVRYLQLKHRLSSAVDMRVLEPVLMRARDRGDQYEVAYGLWVVANQALRERNYAVHQAMMAESLSLWRALGDDFYVAHLLVGSCGEDMTPATSEWALQYLHESVAIRRRSGDEYGLSFSLQLIAMRLMHQGRFEEADAYLDECLALQDAADPTPDFAGIVSLKGLMAFWAGDFEAAARYARSGIDFSQEMNYYGDKSACQALLGAVACMEGRYTRAHELCLYAAQDELFDVIAVTVQWGLALACCGLDGVSARQPLAECLHIACHTIKSPLFQQVGLPLAVVLAAADGQPEVAVELLALALQQPAQLIGWIGQWPLLNATRHDLETQLGLQKFKAAWERGLKLELADVTAHLLDHYAADTPLIP